MITSKIQQLKNQQRTELLNDLKLMASTLKSAVDNINICKGIDGCENVVKSSSEMAFIKIAQMEAKLQELKSLLKSDSLKEN
jgi:DNA-binding transcriptional regulator WhiA